MMEGGYTVDVEGADSADSRSWRSWRVKSGFGLGGILLVLALCLCAALLVLPTGTKDSGQDEENFDLRHTLRQISNVRAAIHLEGEYNSSLKRSVLWKAQVDQFHSQGGLQLKNNEILIPKSGLYFVYSQVSFKVNCSGSEEKDDGSSSPLIYLSHTVELCAGSVGSQDSPVYNPILHSIRTTCQRNSNDPEDRGWFSTVYMGAVFSLGRGDRLRTVMEEDMLPNLEEGAGMNFFGVFAL